MPGRSAALAAAAKKTNAQPARPPFIPRIAIGSPPRETPLQHASKRDDDGGQIVTPPWFFYSVDDSPTAGKPGDKSSCHVLPTRAENNY